MHAQHFLNIGGMMKLNEHVTITGTQRLTPEWFQAPPGSYTTMEVALFHHEINSEKWIHESDGGDQEKRIPE